jgi:hypothetical protein
LDSIFRLLFNDPLLFLRALLGLQLTPLLFLRALLSFLLGPLLFLITLLRFLLGSLLSLLLHALLGLLLFLVALLRFLLCLLLLLVALLGFLLGALLFLVALLGFLLGLPLLLVAFLGFLLLPLSFAGLLLLLSLPLLVGKTLLLCRGVGLKAHGRRQAGYRQQSNDDPTAVTASSYVQRVHRVKYPVRPARYNLGLQRSR